MVTIMGFPNYIVVVMFHCSLISFLFKETLCVILRKQWAIIQFIGSPTSDPPIFSWKSLKDHQTCPKIHFRGFRYLKRGPLQGVLDFMKILKKIHKNLKYGLEPPILVRASSVIPFRKALAIPVAGLYSKLSSQP